MRRQLVTSTMISMLVLASLFSWVDPAVAGGSLPASLRSQIEHFIAERAGGQVESVSVPPLGDFDIEGLEPGDVRIELSTRARGQLSGAVAVNVVVSDDFHVLKRGVVTARVQSSKRVWVAAQELQRGATITRKDLRLEGVDLRSAQSGATSELDRLLGLQLRRSLREGDVLRTNYVEPINVVARGQAVRIVLDRAGLKIVGQGRAVTNGSIGQIIRVVNTDSRREVSGRVESDGSVHVAQ